VRKRVADLGASGARGRASHRSARIITRWWHPCGGAGQIVP